MTQESILPSIRADAPNIKDKLGFASYAKTISQIILDENVETPLTIGIFGSWGTGKTTLMKMIENQIREAALQKPKRQTVPIWFNAWLYSKEEVLWRAFLAQVLTAVYRMDVPQHKNEKNKKLEELKTQLYRTLRARELGSLSFAMTDLLKASGSGAELTLTLQQGFDLLEKIAATTATDEAGVKTIPEVSEQAELAKMLTLRNEVQRAAVDLEQGQLESLDKFRTEFEGLMNEYVTPAGYLVVFVDDLDRCLPEKAVEVLESMKLFLDVKGCIFVLAIDQSVVARGIQLRYGESGKAEADNRDDVIDGSRYLEKIIQIPFVLPPISPNRMGKYVADLSPDLPDPECGNVFAQGLEANPRQVKRAINIYSLLWRLSQNKPELTARVTPVRLAKLVVLQQRHKDLYELLRKKPSRLGDWEKSLRGITKTDGQILDRSKLEAELQDVDDEELQKLHSLLTMHDKDKHDVNFSDLSPDQIYPYVYLTSAVEEMAIPVEQGVEQKGKPPSPQEELAKEADVKSTEDDVGKPVLEAQLPKEISIYSSLKEARLSFVIATVFRDLENQLKQFDGAEFDRQQGEKMGNILGSAGWKLYDQIILPDTRKELGKQLTNPIQIQVAQKRGEERIPWEIVYDNPLPTSIDQPQSKIQQMQEVITIDPDHFWGFKHIIERSGFGYERKEETFSVSDKPMLLAYIGTDIPQVASVDQSIQKWSILGSGSGIYKPLTSLNQFSQSLDMDSGSPRIYILRSQAGIEQGETWIDFGFEETGEVVNLVQLRDVLSSYFNMEELKTLCSSMKINSADLNNENKNSFVLDLIQFTQRRGTLDELIKNVGKERPSVSLNTLSRKQIRLTRQILESWPVTSPLKAILILDVDAGLVQAEDWFAWLSLFYRKGFVGVLAPTIAPDLEDSWPFIDRFIQQFLSGIPIGEALREARRWLWKEKNDPRGLIYTYFGSTILQLGRE